MVGTMSTINLMMLPLTLRDPSFRAYHSDVCRNDYRTEWLLYNFCKPLKTGSGRGDTDIVGLVDSPEMAILISLSGEGPESISLHLAITLGFEILPSTKVAITALEF